MARQDRKSTDRRSADSRSDPDSGEWYGSERGNEFGGEGRFRTEGGYGSHFGGEPDAAVNAGHQAGHQDRNTIAWRGDRRQKLVEKFDRWRSERVARTADRGPVSASADSSSRETGRSAKK